MPNFARACGRVSVGRYPDKRPDSRQGMKNRGSIKSQDLRGQHLSQEMPLKVSSPLATVTGSRRRTGAPRSQRGTRLKATTDRAFLVSTGIPTPARATEKACPSLPGVRAGNSQPIHGSTFGLSPRPRRVSIVRLRPNTHVRDSHLNGPRRWAVWRVL